MALLSGASWFLVDVLSDHHYPQEVIRYWNGFTCLLAFAIIGLVMHHLKQSRDKEQKSRRELEKTLAELQDSTREIRNLQSQLRSGLFPSLVLLCTPSSRAGIKNRSRGVTWRRRWPNCRAPRERFGICKANCRWCAPGRSAFESRVSGLLWMSSLPANSTLESVMGFLPRPWLKSSGNSAGAPHPRVEPVLPSPSSRTREGQCPREPILSRSEERRVGKEGRYRRPPY